MVIGGEGDIIGVFWVGVVVIVLVFFGILEGGLFLVLVKFFCRVVNFC